jgi:Uma2 family endonuclease
MESEATMTTTDTQPMLTPTEYLVRERAAEYRSEYIDGRMVLMTGGSRAHSLIGLNIAATLHEALRGGPCEVHQSDMRVRVAEGAFYTYPDVLVACAPVELEDSHNDTLLQPVVIVEVLSPSTAAYDRGKKRQRYQEISSLKHYLLVEQDRPYVEHHRSDRKGWSTDAIEGLAGSVELAGIGVTLELREVYERVSKNW